MSDVRDDEGDADVAQREPGEVDVTVSGLSGAEVSRAGRDGEAGAAPADGESGAGAAAAAGGDAGPGVVDRLGFWTSWLDLAHGATPEGLGDYLTDLVAEKREYDDQEHACLLACGVIAVMAALGRTAPAGTIGLAEEQQALAMVLARHWLGWPIPRAR